MDILTKHIIRMQYKSDTGNPSMIYIDDIDDQGKWQYELIKAIQPDVFVCIIESYPEEQRKEIKQFVRELVELPRQAENTSTTKIIEKAIKTHLAELKEMVGDK